ncbi:flagellar basal body rod protein FlgC [Pyrinomonas methylaliphatogenes]|jgi:flagellar basal-body rod protein FlgC|uniref:Flagellar basal-body rod protein FlgC n=1 Tax=Pyrinomonas methylaliphatogenes TaxID=454194 RepID=A0A0B6WZD2_9BACT|nr:flagellar basal body rod protein FlgC [Pyrinomonas methylaliphatogenes]MBX5477574.1 flagellar basal body rod protein FlgC [Pyrinomonas methylaliphatogenes]CDM65644.1 flagellar basal-body rod protein FlgC [Pyrinomonas methylaliphatogenes]
MSLITIFRVSSQGMTAERMRLEAAAANLANANTTRTAEGGPYRRRDVVFETVPVETPSASFDSFSSAMSATVPDLTAPIVGVQAKTVITENQAGVRRFQPDHPDSDANGYVTLPDVDPLEETINMLSAARAFEANATAFNTAKELVRASLKLSEA